MRRFYLLLLGLILLGAFWVRLYQFQRPIADWHSWRQSDTSMVSRNFVKNGYDILRPHFDDMSKGVSLIDNPNGYRFVEFPIYNVVQAGLFRMFDQFTIEEWGRLVTIFSVLVSIVFTYLLVTKYTSKRAGLLAAAFLAFVPYNIYYGRVVLPDQSMVAALMGALYFFDKWLEKESILQYILAILFMIVALLLKPYALFFGLPFLYLAFRRFGFSLITNKYIWSFVIVSIAPLIAWRFWMQQFPEGIPRNNWLFNGNNIRFKGAFFHWLFAERIGKMILGYFGLPFVVLGIIANTKKEGLLYISFLASSLIYMSVLATGNVQHDYYQILIIPTLAMLFAKGIDVILDKTHHVFSPIASYAVIFVSISFMLAFGWFIIRDFYNLQHIDIVYAGQAADKILPKDAKVIAPYGGDTTFLYHVNRKGWPVWDRPLKEFMQKGATHMVFVGPGPGELAFAEYFTTMEKGDKYIIYDLTRPLKPFTDK